MAETKYKCGNCGLIITHEGKVSPDKKTGGPCPENSRGNHYWVRL